jgi:exoribonuclease R
MTYKIHIHDRNYTTWDIFETVQFQKVELLINPIQEKMFSNDVFNVQNNKIHILHSTIRTTKDIPGVLIISGNKTYGRNKKGKLLYKCIPDDMRIPAFLVPYEIKHVGFSKVYINLYISFTFSEWVDKHPMAIISKVIGPVNVLDNFYEYQLYCKSLNASIQKFQKATTSALENKSHDLFIESIQSKYPSIQDRTNNWYIFTIDPPNSLDLDDAFSIRPFEENGYQLTIYISNVTIWMDVLNVWEAFSRRISTIYLPDKKRPMLPTLLSDSLCSLQSDTTRIAFYMDIFINNGEIININYGNCFIKVAKNYSYEQPELLTDVNYQVLLSVTRSLTKKYKYINSIKNSHDVVSYLMVLMNCRCAENLIKHNTGIFRSTMIKRSVNIPNHIPEEVSKFIKIWNSSTGQYINGHDIIDEKNRRHELLDMDAYIHITSPIRRLVDLLNIIQFQEVTGLISLSENASKFYNNWLNDLEYINTTMRSIRKVQCDCTLLDICSNQPNVMEKEYNGYIFDKISRTDGLFQFIVFLPDLKMSSRITTRENLENFESKKFKLFIFHDEEKFKRKIRLQLL